MVYLRQFSANNPEWTRALFLRDSKERLLSAFLDKILHRDSSIVFSCCHAHGVEACCDDGFFQVCSTCHTMQQEALAGPQSHWMEEKCIQTLNFVDHMDNYGLDVQAMLERLGAMVASTSSSKRSEGKAEEDICRHSNCPPTMAQPQQLLPQRLSREWIPPTADPSRLPSDTPFTYPSNLPSTAPSFTPTSTPSEGPTGSPTRTSMPSISASPSVSPASSTNPSLLPSGEFIVCGEEVCV